ncbi:MAG TPA: FHA domain-containing protein [Gemmata sp.]
MSDPLIARFAEACGATAPLHLRVDLVGGGVLAEGLLHQPFALVGRDDACDVTLSDPDVNPRHMWLQVLGGRVYALDLGSRTGVVWPSGVRGSGWLDPGTGAKLGPFLLRVRGPVAAPPSAFAPEYNPLAADPSTRHRAPATLEFRNGKRARDRWAVNRVLTLVGRSPECKIHLTADDISPYHCGLVSTPAGLWVVDLSGRGVVVNGERMRVAPLPHGAELWVGRFLIGCQSPGPLGATGAPVSSNGAPTGPRTPNPAPADQGAANVSSVSKPPRVPALVGATGRPARDEDEVELGAAPDPTADLPASHIMADAFREPGPSGPPSNPVLVSGTPGGTGTADGPLAGLFDTLGFEHAGETGLVPLLRQMAELHHRAAQEFARWLALLPRLFANAPREHLPVVLHELTRIEALTAEITKLQGEVSRRALEQAAAHREQLTAPEPVPHPDTPAPVRAIDTITPAPTRAADQLLALQQERADRWAAVLALFAAR